MKDCRLAAVDSAIQLQTANFVKTSPPTLLLLVLVACRYWIETFFPHQNVFPNKLVNFNFFSRSFPAQIRTRRWIESFQ